MASSWEEKRKHPRIYNEFRISYRLVDKANTLDITKTKNISLGGAHLTTNTKFTPGDNLGIEIRLPFDPHPIVLVAKVIASRERPKDELYNTHIEFLSVDDEHKKIVIETVEYYLKLGDGFPPKEY